MTKNGITIRHSILIAKSRELVWDYTQNYVNRTIWDHSIIETTVLQTIPSRMVKLKMRGNTTMTFIYKHDERPHMTTLVAKDIQSYIILSAGGSWRYEEQNGKTLWTQTNTIAFKENFLLVFLLPIYKYIFSWMLKKAMWKAKQEIEKL